LKLVGRTTLDWNVKSPPTRGRGLKLHHPHRLLVAWKSPPTRGRGLKHEGILFQSP